MICYARGNELRILAIFGKLKWKRNGRTKRKNWCNSSEARNYSLHGSFVNDWAKKREKRMGEIIVQVISAERRRWPTVEVETDFNKIYKLWKVKEDIQLRFTISISLSLVLEKFPYLWILDFEQFNAIIEQNIYWNWNDPSVATRAISLSDESLR